MWWYSCRIIICISSIIIKLEKNKLKKIALITGATSGIGEATAKGKIFVIRSTGGKGSMYPIDIELNQNLLGSIKNSQIVIGDVSKGENKLYITYSVFGGVECNEDKKIFFSEENESHFFVIQMASQPDFWSINNECMKIYKTDESAFRVARGNPYTAGDEFKEFLKDIPSDLIDDVIRGDF